MVMVIYVGNIVLGCEMKELVIIILNIVFIISNIRKMIIINNECECLFIIFLDNVFIDLFLWCELVYKVFILCILVNNIVLNIIYNIVGI